MSATPESREDRYGDEQPGRPKSDWEAIRAFWYDCAPIRDAYRDAFSVFEFQVYAEPRTQKTAEGRRLTALIWALMREQGIVVSIDPPHFTLPRPVPDVPR